jgi:hypothetical protein
MDVLAAKILAMFGSFNKETLDLHELFEAGVMTLMLALLCSIRLSVWLKMDCWRSAAMIFMP